MHRRRIAMVLAVTTLLEGCTEPGALAGSNGQKAAPVSDPSANQTALCPGATFEKFLEAYASDDKVRREFTRPQVKVVTSDDIGEDSVVGTRMIDASEYSGFNLRHEGDGFHVVDADGVVDPETTSVSVKPEEAGYLVSYRYGMSEGNSYRFVKERGCWFLAEDPEPPSP